MLFFWEKVVLKNEFSGDTHMTSTLRGGVGGGGGGGGVRQK